MNNVPIRSGTNIVDAVFDMCVELLLFLGQIFGLSYNAINVLIFCVIWPLFTVGLIVALLWKHKRKKPDEP